MMPAASQAQILRAQRYFNVFLPKMLGKLMIEDLRTLDAAFDIRLVDHADERWHLVIDAGKLMHVGHVAYAPQCSFNLDTATFLEIVRGETSAQEAFFAMRAEIKGDVELGLKLSTVLECFFERFPFRE